MELDWGLRRTDGHDPSLRDELTAPHALGRKFGHVIRFAIELIVLGHDAGTAGEIASTHFAANACRMVFAATDDHCAGCEWLLAGFAHFSGGQAVEDG